MALIFIIKAFDLSRTSRQWGASLFDQLFTRLVKADRRALFVIIFRIQIQDVFHTGDKLRVEFADAPLLFQPGFKFVFLRKTNQAAVAIMDGQAQTDFENCYRHKDGQLIHIMWSAFWSESEKLMYCVARDISERKRAEQLAEGQRLELEVMATSLTAANKELEAFSYSVSHDLRAPLRAVDGFSRILLEDYAERLDDEGNRVLNVIRTNTQNMGRLIDDLLAFSRLGRKQIEPSMIDLGELARDVFAQLESSPGVVGSPHLEIKQIPPAHGDRALLRQVFVNLLSNAAKYSKQAERPAIEVGGRGENGENIYYVKDNGVGFDMKYVNKLFGVFQRLHSVEEFEGTGVGLAIVQRIIQRHGGRVWAEGRLNEGATFYFALPRNGEKHRELHAE